MKITAMDWAVIKTSFERGEKTPQELADDYGVQVQTITKGLRDRGAVRNSTLSETVEDENDAARRERDARVEQARAQRDKFAKYSDAIANMVIRRVVDGDKNGDLRSKNPDMLVLKNAMAIIARARKENWEILRVEDVLEGEESLPDLNVGEYTPEELEAIRQANEENYLEGLDDGEDEVELPDVDEDD